MFCFVFQTKLIMFQMFSHDALALANRQEAVSNARRTHGDKYLPVTGLESLKCKCHVINDNEDCILTTTKIVSIHLGFFFYNFLNEINHSKTINIVSRFSENIRTHIQKTDFQVKIMHSYRYMYIGNKKSYWSFDLMYDRPILFRWYVICYFHIWENKFLLYFSSSKYRNSKLP